MEWLHEAAAETYLPLLRVFARLERDGLSLCCNLNLSPVLLEQLAHPVFKAEFPNYLERKILAAREDEAFFTSIGDAQFAATARFWQQFFHEALRDFEALGREITAGFRGFQDRGRISIITCAASHGYLPLLGTDESLRAQVRTAVATHERHLGRAPRGIWIPECGYRPTGEWAFPVEPLGAGENTATPAAEPQTGTLDRIGVEQALAESGIEFFFVDTHLVEEGHLAASPYSSGQARYSPSSGKATGPSHIYHPFYVAGAGGRSSGVTAFSRDPQTGLQVWSADFGFPGDERYLDFHKKRWPGGHRYWRVTGANVDLGHKDRYDPGIAAARVRDHASHFVALVRQTLEAHLDDDVPPILCSPFDAELFGHWWFEGPLWLEAVVRELDAGDTGIALTTCVDYLERYPGRGTLAIGEGSWGAEGNNQVWLNNETAWTYARLYGAELDCRRICSSGAWRGSGLGERLVGQLCRELLLLESSDWQFLITTGAARDYAEQRFNTHYDQFVTVRELWEEFRKQGTLPAGGEERLAHIEERDNIFPDIDPAFWSHGAHGSASAAARDFPFSEAGSEATLQPSLPGDDASKSQVQKFLPSPKA